MNVRQQATAAADPADARVLLELFVARAPVGIAFLDADLRYLLVNETAAEINGLAPEAHLGRTIDDVLPAVARIAEPVCRQVLATGVPAIDLEVTGETPGQPGVPRTWVASYYPVAGDSGTIAGIGAIVRDVTVERRLAAEHADTERLFRTTIERVTDGFVALDRDWRYTYVNEVAAAMFGRTPDQLVGRHIWTEFPEGVGQPFHLAYERAMAEQHVVTFEDYYEPWDRYFENRVYPSPEGITIFFSEITERRRTERELARNRARFEVLHRVERAILEARTPEAIAPEALAATRTVLNGDQAGLARFDPTDGCMTVIALDGRPLGAVTAGMTYPLPPHAIEALSAGEPVVHADLEAWRHEPPLAMLADEGVRTLLTVPLRSGSDLVGQLNVAWFTVQDMTEARVDIARQIADTLAIAMQQSALYEAEHAARTAAEHATARTRALLSITDLAMASLPLAAFLTEITERLRDALQTDVASILLAAPDGSLGLAASSGRAGNLDAAPLPSDTEIAARVIAERRTVMAGGPGGADQAGRSGSIIGTPLQLDERVIGVLLARCSRPRAFDPDARTLLELVADRAAGAIERTRLAEELAAHSEELEERVEDRTHMLTEMNEELDAFSYTVSHDLRAPLRAMQGYATALVEDEADRLSPVGRGYADRIVAAAARMEALTADLLAYSRLGRGELRMQLVDLDRAVEHALAQLEVQIHESGATVDIDRPLGHVLAHPATLDQVVANLLGNALKFVAPGERPAVTVRSAGADGKRRLWVEDRGLGVAEEHRERIFRVFERLHGQEAYPGTGIGLAIVRKACERMGGQCGVEAGDGQGARFWIELAGAGATPR